MADADSPAQKNGFGSIHGEISDDLRRNLFKDFALDTSKILGEKWGESWARQLKGLYVAPVDQNVLKGLSPLLTGALSRPDNFRAIPTAPASYSPELTSAADYFAPDEKLIRSFDELHAAIRRLADRVDGMPLVWRGVRDARWGLHSNLFRELKIANGVKDPSLSPRGVQPYPSEDQMVTAETALLRVARSEWRSGGVPALELLARMQHFGAPTRLLDVSKNPYIATWFAIESSADTDQVDARLFALGTAPVGATQASGIGDDTDAMRSPFWHYFTDTKTRQEADWGTGAKRRIWVPPAYDSRIAAQNAAFVIDGVPMISEEMRRHFPKPGGGTWSKADLLASSSVFVKTTKVTGGALRPHPADLAPTFSFRITAEAKAEIRRYLEQLFGYRVSSIYPDMARMSQYLKENFKQIVASHGG